MKQLLTRACIPVVLFAIVATFAFATIAGAQQSSSQQGTAQNDYSRIELAYAQVAKYYNKGLSDSEAMYIAKCILYYSSQYSLDPRLVVALIVVESRFKPNATSPKGAQGLGQLMPGTARYLGVSNAYDVAQNIQGTTKYLREQYDRWQSSDKVLDYMLASYNAGPKSVEKYGGIPPYSETRNYVVKVKKLYKYFVYGP